ncbi:MAG: DUF86 domain-containing protein [Myxococcales bacterium]|nr:DUF86 domain-containing protein [Myxococcales bacterium]
MSRSPDEALLDMRDAALEVVAFVEGQDYASFQASLLRTRAVERSLAIVGEAAKRVSPAVRVAHPGVPWRKVAGLRDVLVHDYFGIDLEILWQVATVEIPTLLGPREDVIAVVVQTDDA